MERKISGGRRSGRYLELKEAVIRDLKALLEKQENQLRQYNEYNVTLTKQYNQKVEQRFVLELTSGFFKESYNKMKDEQIALPQDTYSNLGLLHWSMSDG